MDVIVKISAEQVINAFTNAGLSQKRINRALVTNTQMPLNGTFTSLDFKVFKDLKGVEHKYPVLTVSKGEKIIGNIAIGTLLQQISSGKARQIKRSDSEYVGKWFHAGKPLSNIEGLTEAEQISNLIGRSYTAKEVKDATVAKFVLDTNDKPVFYGTEEEAIKAIESKDCYQFKITD